jgi:hypothetical protein
VGAALAGALLTAATAGAATAPRLATVHAIFDSSAGPPFQVGQVLDVVARRSGKTSPGAVRRVCFTPAPIARPACSSSTMAAPSAAGTTRITVSFTRHAPVALHVKVRPAATKVGALTKAGGSIAVPASVTCTSLSLYPTVGSAKSKTGTPLATLPKATKVALYNTIAQGIITIWNYATNTAAFGDQTCTTPGI